MYYLAYKDVLVIRLSTTVAGVPGGLVGGPHA